MKELLLCPMPQKLRRNGKTADLRGARWIRISPVFSSALKRHFIAFAEKYGSLFGEGLELTAGSPVKGDVFLEAVLRQDAKENSQKFSLTITAGGIKIIASGEAGIFYGLQTVAQLIELNGCKLPCLEIEDWPDFRDRGVMLDISRCKVPTMKTLFELADLLASLKINHIELYTEHTFAFSGHEIVWGDSSPMTSQEIIEFDAYCADRFIELVPNLNSFGHFDRWLKHQEYRHLAESPDGYLTPWGEKASHGSTMKPATESIEFLSSLYGEFLPNFQSGSFNVGCDETWEIGTGWSKPQCDKKGKTKVYLDHLLEIHKIVRKNRRKMMFWADIILHDPKYVDELPRDIIALNWGYEKTHPYEKETAIFAKYGVPFYVCPGTSSWNSLTGRTDNCINNLLSAAKHGSENGAAGFLNTDWGDGGHHQYLPISYLGFLAGAAYSWSLKSSKDIDVAEALNRFVFKDSASVTGGLFYELGKVHEKSGVERINATTFNFLLFHFDMTDKKSIENLKLRDMEVCLRSFNELRETASSMRPEIPDGMLVREEFLNAISMAELGVMKAVSCLGGKSDRTLARKSLVEIIARHEALWFARNRIGGLNESSARLRNVMKCFE